MGNFATSSLLGNGLNQKPILFSIQHPKYAFWQLCDYRQNLEGNFVSSLTFLFKKSLNVYRNARKSYSADRLN